MAQQTIYLGTYTGPKSQGIYRCTLDETGQLSAPELVAPIKNPSFVALSPNGKTLYAVCDAGGSAVGAWSIAPGGQLTALGTQPSGGGDACHLSIDATGKTVVVANYGGGSVASFPIREDGSLAPSASLIQHTGNGPNKNRQEKPHAHSIYVDPTNKFVYSCDLGTDKVLIYVLDPNKGTLTLADPPFATVPPGAGPRHLAFSPSGYVYVNNEMGLSVTAFKRNPTTGALTEIQTVPTIPADAPTQGVTTSEIFAHPTGPWLYVSNRGRNTILRYNIAPNGQLTYGEETPTPNEPRGFALSPDGKWLVAAGQKDNQVAAYRIDPTTGKLTPSGTPIEVGTPVSVLFANK
jgi:6-phosphogluconolactonase